MRSGNRNGEHANVDGERPPPEHDPAGVLADTERMRGMPPARDGMGALAAVPDLRARRLLRLFSAPARPRGRPPHRPVVRTGRELALMLCRQTVRLSPGKRGTMTHATWPDGAGMLARIGRHWGWMMTFGVISLLAGVAVL